MAPLAMVIGLPYIRYWEDENGTAAGDAILYSSEEWPNPPPGSVPVAPNGLLQEFDPHWVDIEGSERIRAKHPSEQPEIWPFPESFRPPKKITAVADLEIWPSDKDFTTPPEGTYPLVFRFGPHDGTALQAKAVDRSPQSFAPGTTHTAVHFEFWSQAARSVVVPGAAFTVFYNGDIGTGHITALQ